MKFRALAAAAALTLGGLAFTAPAFAAAPTIAKINNTANGEAGYFVNDNGSTRIRDVQASTVVTPQMENLNGVNLLGGTGVELCNDNTGDAAQLGLEWTGTAFTVEYGYTPHFAQLTAPAASATNPDPDPCAEGGLLNGGTGISFPNSFIPAIGDTIHFEVYYNPKGNHTHSLKFLAEDVTQDITRVQTVQVPEMDFYEAGVGVLTDGQTLTGGPVNLVNAFTGTSFNWYGNKGAAPDSILSSSWDTEMADFVNASNQVTLSPNASLNSAGTGFSDYEGSTSP